MSAEVTQKTADRLTEIIIGCAMRVSNTLGVGFLEKVYENALVIELRNAGLRAEQQQEIAVLYNGLVVGKYEPDILVNSEVVIEVKAVRAFDQVHMAQLLNYLKATNIRVGLLLNFGTPRLGVKRMVM